MGSFCNGVITNTTLPPPQLHALDPDATSPWWLTALELIKDLTSKSNKLDEVLLPFVENSLAEMLVNHQGGAYLEQLNSESNPAPTRKNKRQRDVSNKRTEDMSALGHHDNLNFRFKDLDSLLNELTAYTTNFSVVERYQGLDSSKEFGLVNALSQHPSAAEIMKNGNCRVCRREARKTGSECDHCGILAVLDKKKGDMLDRSFTCIINAVHRFVASLANGHGVASAKGTSDNPVYPFADLDSIPELELLDELATKFDDVRELGMVALEQMINHHKSHQNLLGGLDELKVRMGIKLRQSIENDVGAEGGRGAEGTKTYPLTNLSSRLASLVKECVTTARLRLVGEFAASDSLVEDGMSLQAKISNHEMQHKAALASLEDSKRHLSYLLTLETNEERGGDDGGGTAGGDVKETCMICLEEFEEECALLQCGHKFHPPCLDRWIKDGKGQGRDGIVECVLRCPRKGLRKEVLFSSTRAAAEEAQEKAAAAAAAATKATVGVVPEDLDPSRSLSPSPTPFEPFARAPLLPANVIGARNFGSKISKLVEILLKVRDSGEKALVMSLYDDTINIVNEALKVNGIRFNHNSGSTRFGDCIDKWRRDSSTALVFNIRQGAEGLTLVEAAHVFIVDPLVDSWLDSQAVARIHRIGQTKATKVHRFIVKQTVEEYIHAERIERGVALESGEIDQDDIKGAEVIKGGGDSGFSIDELRKMFGMI